MKSKNLKDRIDEIKTRRFEENVEGLRGHKAKPLEDLFPDLTSRTVKEILDEIIKMPFSYEPTSNVYHNEARFRLSLLKELNELGFTEEVKPVARSLANYYMDLSFNFKGKPPQNGSRESDINSTIDCLDLAHAPEELCSLGGRLFSEHEYRWKNAMRCYEIAGSLENIVSIGKSYLEEGNLDNAYEAFKKGQAENKPWELFERKADEFLQSIEEGSSEFCYGKSPSTLKEYYLERENKEKVKKIIILYTSLRGEETREDEELFETLNPSREEYEQLAGACLRDIVNPKKAIGLYRKAGTKPNKEKFTEAMKKNINAGQVLSGVAEYLVTFPDLNVELFEDLYNGIITAPYCWAREIKEINSDLKTVNRQIPQSTISQHASWLLKESPYYPSSAIELYKEFGLKPDIKGIEKAIEYCLNESGKSTRTDDRNEYEDKALKAHEYLEKLIKNEE